LHNVSHSYSLDHQHEGELFAEMDRCLGDLKRIAGLKVGGRRLTL
jgi:zinc finger-like protein